MSTLDFLFSGSPPPATTQYGQTTQSVPAWYSDYEQGLLNTANSVAATPYQAYQGPQVAGFTDPQTQSFNQVQNLQGAYTPTLQSGINDVTQAGQTNPLASANPYLQQSASLTGQAIDPSQSGLAAAQPYLDAASQKFTDPGVAQSYMNPYESDVINAAGVQAGQQFQNQILPQIQNTFGAAGQYGSSNMQKVVGQQANQMAQSLQSQAQAALASGYQNAGQMFTANQQQQGALGQLAGTLATQQQGAQLQGASQLSQLGLGSGQLGALGGQLQLGAGQQLGALGQTGQTMGLTDAAALNQVGQQQQNLNQTNLSTAYQNFLNQTQYPQNQTNWLSNIIRGQAMPTSTSTAYTQPATGANSYSTTPAGVLSANNGSGLGSLVGLLG